MKRQTNGISRLSFILFLGVIAAFFLALWGLQSHWALIHLPMHSTIETAGGISALLIALVLFQQKREFQNGVFFWVGTGIGCMGLLDTFHAMSMPGEAFVFLHSTASLAGSVFFSCIYLHENRFLNNVSDKRWITGIAFFLCFTVGIRALLFPRDVPTIVYVNNGDFTVAAVLMNYLAGILFLVTVPGFFFRYKRGGHKDLLVFAALALLFGLAELLFPFSDTWDALWWFWHLLRFTAYMLTLILLVSRHVHLSGNDKAL